MGCHVLQELLQSNLLDEAGSNLCKPISLEEVRLTIFGIGDEKAPRPDGYTAKFFKKAWNIVGNEVVVTILSYFHSSKLLPAFNSTSITLVPKVQSPESIKEYRPISCCYVVYKCITKILANRLK